MKKMNRMIQSIFLLKLVNEKKIFNSGNSKLSMSFLWPDNFYISFDVIRLDVLLLDENKYKIDGNWTQTQNHLVLKRTLNYLAKWLLTKFVSIKFFAYDLTLPNFADWDKSQSEL